VADNDDDGALPDDDQQAAPADDTKKPRSPQDDQLQKAIQVLKNKPNKA